MKNSFYFKLFLFLFFLFPSVLFAEDESYKTNNFYASGPFPYDSIKEWGFLAEQRRKDLAHKLGFYYVGRWDPLCRLQFSPSKRHFRKMSGAPGWSRGWSRTQRRMRGEKTEVLRSIWVVSQRSDEKLEPLLSHEIAHLLFREFLEYPEDIPLWLDEGVAIWAEENTRRLYTTVTYKAVVKDRYLPFATFFTMKRYPSDKRLFYSQSSSIIRYLLSEYGSAEFQRFSRLIRDGEPFEKAMTQIYGARTAGLSEFEEDWKEWVLQNKY